MLALALNSHFFCLNNAELSIVVISSFLIFPTDICKVIANSSGRTTMFRTNLLIVLPQNVPWPKILVSFIVAAAMTYETIEKISLVSNSPQVMLN